MSEATLLALKEDLENASLVLVRYLRSRLLWQAEVLLSTERRKGMGRIAVRLDRPQLEIDYWHQCDQCQKLEPFSLLGIDLNAEVLGVDVFRGGGVLTSVWLRDRAGHLHRFEAPRVSWHEGS